MDKEKVFILGHGNIVLLKITPEGHMYWRKNGKLEKIPVTQKSAIDMRNLFALIEGLTPR